MFKLVLLGLLLLLAAAQAAPFSAAPPQPLAPPATDQLTVGGYKPYTDLSSVEFQTVLNFIHSQRPQMAGYQPSAVSRQLVNGFNYRVSLTNQPGCTAELTVYSSFQGQRLMISSETAPNCPQTTTQTPLDPPVVPPQHPSPTDGFVAGGYTVQSDPSGDTFESALTKALSQNVGYRRSDLVLTETQVVSGTNYRFTFRNQDGSLAQTVIYVPLGGFREETALPEPEETPLPEDAEPVFASMPSPIAGGWSELWSPDEYSDALQAIYQSNPEVKDYRVVGAESQVVAGLNYRIGLQNNSADALKYALFIVYFNLGGQPTTTLLQWISISAYSVQELIQKYGDSLKLHSQLKGASLVSIENIWTREGVDFVFRKEEQQYEVYIYQKNGQTRNLIF